MKKVFTLRVNIAIIFLILMIIAINPNPWAKGVQIKGVERGSMADAQGLSSGEIIKSINGEEINTLADFKRIDGGFIAEPINVSVKTNEGIFSEIITEELGFNVDNLTVSSVTNFTGIKEGMKIEELNWIKVNDTDSFYNIANVLIPKKKVVIVTNKKTYAFLTTGTLKISVGEAKKSNVRKGLDLEGGTRVLLKPESEKKVTDKQVSDLISVLSNRLNVYGLSDLRIRSASDWVGNKFVVIEIAGATQEEVKELIAKQGVFEARIGNETVFSGGEKDIPFVCRNDGSCSGIRPPCNQVSNEQWACTFAFAISLSGDAAKRHAEITKELAINVTEGGKEILSKNIDFYLDNKKVDSLQISADLKGKEATQIEITGPGFGVTQEAAFNDALKNMDRLQTILITGSLPLKLNIVKLDTISPILGQRFVKNSVIVGIFALIGVALVIFIRYRQFKISVAIMLTMMSELIMVFGIAALIGWNIDVAAIAGIIAAIGTGVDDQIVITDETMKRKGQEIYSWKQKMKRAFFIIMGAYATIIAAMIPLWNAGAGLLRGFAVTTIIGISVGVFVTRPAFASIVERLLKE